MAAADGKLEPLQYTRAVWTCNVCLRLARLPVMAFQGCTDNLHVYCERCIQENKLERCIRSKCNGCLPLLVLEDVEGDLPRISHAFERLHKIKTGVARAEWKTRDFEIKTVEETLAPEAAKIAELNRQLTTILSDQAAKQKEEQKEQEAKMRELEAAKAEQQDREDQLRQLEAMIAELESGRAEAAQRAQLEEDIKSLFQQVLEAEAKQVQSKEKFESTKELWHLRDPTALRKRIEALKKSLKEQQAHVASLRSELISAGNKEIQRSTLANLQEVENAITALASKAGTTDIGVITLPSARASAFQTPELVLSSFTFDDLALISQRLSSNTCSFVRLQLDHACLGDAHVFLLSRALCEDGAAPHLEYLSLRGNQFGNGGAAALQEALSLSPYTAPRRLRQLQLDDNGGLLSEQSQKEIDNLMLVRIGMRKYFPTPNWSDNHFRSLHEQALDMRHNLLIRLDAIFGLLDD